MTTPCVWKWTAILTLWLAFAAVVPTIARADLSQPAAKKALVKCQAAIAKNGSKFLAAKLKGLDTCTSAVLSCIQTKPEDAACMQKAKVRCVSIVQGDIVEAERKLSAAIVKACAGPLDKLDLLASDGLGLAPRAGTCSADFNLDICEGVLPVADCLMREHERAAERLFPQAQPRAHELLDEVLPTPLPLPFLTPYPDCDGCALSPANPVVGKAIARCGTTITKAAKTFAVATQKSLEECVGKIFACDVGKASDPICLTKARSACDAKAAKVDAARAKLAAAVGKRCGDTPPLTFATLSAMNALNLGALSKDCFDAGTGAVGSIESYLQCLQQQHECEVADLIRTVLPPSERATTSTIGGKAAAFLAATGCPEPASAARAHPRFGFFKIGQFFAMTKRGLGGSHVPSNTVAGGRGPISTTFHRRIEVPQNTRFNPRFGQVVKIRQLGPPVGLARSEAVATTPMLIVTVRRDDVVLADHLELPLDVVAPGDAKDVELEVEYAKDLQFCAFEIEFAVDDGGVSDYTALAQVKDEAAPTAIATPTPPALATPTPTPTTPPTPTKTPTPTATVTGPTGTPAGPTVTRSATPTPTRTPTATITAVPSNLHVHVAVFPNPARPSEQVKYEYTVTNAGGDLAAVTLTSAVPTQFNGVSVSDGASCTGTCSAGDPASWSLGAMKSGETRTRWLSGPIGAAVTDGTVIHTVAQASAGGAPTQAATDLLVKTAVGGGLQVSVTESVDPVVANGELIYTVNFANRGPSSVASAMLHLTVPDAATIQEISPGGSAVGQVVGWSLGDLVAGAGGERTVRVHVDAPPGNLLVVTAVADASLGEHATAEQATAVTAGQPLLLSKTLVPSVASRANSLEDVVYELTVTNTGTDLVDVTLDETLPQEAFVEQADAGATCAGGCNSGNPIRWTLSGLAAGEARSRQFVVRPSSGYPDGELVVTPARATTNTGIEVRAGRALRLSDKTGLHVTLTESSDPVQADTDLVYTLSFANRGPNSVTGAVAEVTLPATTTIQEVSHGGTVNGQTVEWQLGDLVLGVGGERTVRVHVAPQANTTLLARAVADADLGEQATAEQATAVVASPPLVFTKTVHSNSVDHLEYVTYELGVTNRGSSPVALTLTDLVPSEVFFDVFDNGTSDGLTCPSGCSAGNLVTWNLDVLNVGETRTRQYVVRPSTSYPNGELITTASARAVTASGLEARAARTVRTSDNAGLHVALTESADPVQSDTDLVYTVSFANRGPNAVANPVLQLTLPAEVTIKDISPGGSATGQVVEWELPALAVGTGGERTVRVHVDAPPKSVLYARAVGEASLGEQATAEETTTVVATQPLLLTKTVTPGPAARNEMVVYELTATNNTAGSMQVTLRDLVPQEVFLDSTDAEGRTCPNGCAAGRAILWNLDVLQAGETQTRRVVARPSTAYPNGELILTTARATASHLEVRAGRHLLVSDQTALVVGVTESADPVPPDGTLTYTVSYGNRGASSSLFGAAAVLTLPPELDVAVGTISDGGSEIAPHVVRWELGDLAAGASGTRTVSVAVHAPDKAVVLAHVEATATGAQAVGEQVTKVLASIPLQVVKTVSVNPVGRNQLVTYSLTVTNNGPTAVVTLDDVLPRELAIQSLDGGLCEGFSCSIGEIVSWGLGPMNTGQVVTKSVVGKAYTVAGGPAGELIHNSARAFAFGAEARSSVDLRVGN